MLDWNLLSIVPAFYTNKFMVIGSSIQNSFYCDKKKSFNIFFIYNLNGLLPSCLYLILICGLSNWYQFGTYRKKIKLIKNQDQYAGLFIILLKNCKKRPNFHLNNLLVYIKHWNTFNKVTFLNIRRPFFI